MALVHCYSDWKYIGEPNNHTLGKRGRGWERGWYKFKSLTWAGLMQHTWSCSAVNWMTLQAMQQWSTVFLSLTTFQTSVWHVLWMWSRSKVLWWSHGWAMIPALILPSSVPLLCTPVLPCRHCWEFQSGCDPDRELPLGYLYPHGFL